MSDIDTIWSALKEATAEHLRHHQLLPEWSSSVIVALHSLDALAKDADQVCACLDETGGRQVPRRADDWQERAVRAEKVRDELIRHGLTDLTNTARKLEQAERERGYAMAIGNEYKARVAALERRVALADEIIAPISAASEEVANKILAFRADLADRVWDNTLMDGLDEPEEDKIDTRIVRIQAAETKVAALEAAVRWALGEGDSDFPSRGEGDPPYWWRKELRRRAALANLDTKETP